MARCARISSWKSCSSSLRRRQRLNHDAIDISLLLARCRGRLHHSTDRVDQLGPPRFLAKELLPAFGRDAVELGALVRLGLTPLRRHPALLGEPLESGIE